MLENLGSLQHISHRERAPAATVYMNQEQFDKVFHFQPPPSDSQSFWRQLGCRCSLSALFRTLISFFPILSWLPSYEWRENVVGDLAAGVTVGIVHVPQSIAYAILTGVDPVYGLYTSFFGVLLYMILGTSQYVSVGSFAIISLMTGVSCRNIKAQIEHDFIESEIQVVDDAHLHHMSIDFNNLTALVPHVEVSHAELVQLITLASGLIQIFMALLRVEFLAAYLSDQLVSGFCTGAAVHVVIVQSNKLMQVNVGRHTGLGYLLHHISDFIDNIYTANFTALTISIGAAVFLYVGKDVLAPRLRKALPAPIPYELLLVVSMTAVSAIWNLTDTAGIAVVKEVPVGLPIAKMPRVELLTYVIGPAFEIAFVVVALHLSMCKVFNRKLGTKTDNNQELYAIGILSSLSSFFNTYPISSSLGRSMLNVECGAKTQLSSLFTGILLLVVILFLGPLLSALPMCVLAVIIIYSMKGVFQKMPHELAHLYRVAKIDLLIWLVTFLATVVLNVMQGLIVAVVFALLTTVFRIQWPRWRMLSQLTGTEEYRDCGRYARVTDVDGVRIFRFDAPLLFTNVDHFANSIETAIMECTTPQLATLHRFSLALPPKPTVPAHSGRSFVARIFATNKEEYEKSSTRRCAGSVHVLIIDCSGFTFIDYTSVSALVDVFSRLQARGLTVFFAEAKAPVRDILEAMGFYKHVNKCNFFPTIHDAVLAATVIRRATLSTGCSVIDAPLSTPKQSLFCVDAASIAPASIERPGSAPKSHVIIVGGESSTALTPTPTLTPDVGGDSETETSTSPAWDLSDDV